jgi:hypothetical protein
LFQRLDLPGAMGTPVTPRVDIVRGRNPRTSDPWEFPVFRFQSQLLAHRDRHASARVRGSD